MAPRLQFPAPLHMVSKVLMPLAVETRAEQDVPAGQYEGGSCVELHVVSRRK